MKSLDNNHILIHYRNDPVCNVRVPLLMYLNLKCMLCLRSYRSLCSCSSVLVLSYFTCSASCWLWASLSRWLMVLQRAWASSQYFSNFSILSLLSFTLFSRDAPRASQAKRSASHALSYTNTDTWSCSSRPTPRAWKSFCLPFPSSASALLQLCCASFGAVRETV